MQQMSSWKNSREFPAGYFRLWLLLKVHKIFGRTILKIAMFPIVLTAFLFMKNARRASLEYLAVLSAYTDGKSPSANIINAFKHIHYFALSLVDKLGAWTGSITDDALNHKYQDALTRFISNIQSKKGIFILCSHLGNIEILRALATDSKYSFTVNAFMDIEQTQAFNDFIARVNPKARFNLYSTHHMSMNTAFMVKEMLEHGEVVVFAADRTVDVKNRKAVSFLGRNAYFPTGVFRFALAAESDICFLAICTDKNEKYDVHLNFYQSEIIGKEDIINHYVAWLEALVVAYPMQWYNFYNFWH
jgi:predicted LPLAT superfamily acyltransferase